jgi:arylsulfatase A-like enzyme
MRPAVRRGCLVAAIAVIVILSIIVVWTLRRSLAIDTYGVEPEVFRNPEKAAIPVESVIPWVDDSAPRPNIIVILADDLGYGDLGVQGSRAIHTPHMNALAAEGMRFTASYTTAPVCSPSRAGLLTGRYPLRSGFITPAPAAGDTLMRKFSRQLGIITAKLGAIDIVGGDNPVYGLPPSEITIAEALRVAGYRSSAIGKWHIGDFTEWPEYHPFNHGFDHFVGFNMSNDDWPVAFWRGEEQLIEDIGVDQEQYTGLFTEAAIEFIEGTGDQPFFLYLAHKDPHQPFFPSERFAGKSEGGPYGDAVEELDWSVGEIVAALRRLEIETNTLVVVTSDNGPWYEGSAGGLRGRKGQSYEGGFRVPFIAWWPGQVPAGSMVDAPSMHTDLFPTFLALAGLGLPTDRVIDGVDIWPVLSGRDSDVAERMLVFFQQYDAEAVRVGRWKLNRSASHWVWPIPLDKRDNLAGTMASNMDYRPTDGSEPVPALGSWPMLYDLQQDPGESYNVTLTHPEVARELGDRLEAWRQEFYANPRGWR